LLSHITYLVMLSIFRAELVGCDLLDLVTFGSGTRP
jgi:hypothetical protein